MLKKKILVYCDTQWAIGRIYKDLEKYLTNDFKALQKNEALRDCMIEHVFERIWLNIILELKGEFSVLE